MISAQEGKRFAQFVTSKLGEEADACEDVVEIRQRGGEIRIAAADGATTSSFSREWADLLARWYVRYTQGPSIEALARYLPVLGRQWFHGATARPLPWHAEEKVRQGAYATLLGVTIRASRWTAIAMGDTCLFHVRAGSLLTAFPYTTSEAFAQRPFLASSAHRTVPDISEHVYVSEGDIVHGDLLILATDGLAQWLLRNVEAERNPWSLFTEDGATQLAATVDEERAERRMRNDDVGCAWYHG